MSKLVIDADGLIKLGKSGALVALVRAHELLVPAAVYEEAVVEGKRMLHEDAFVLEEVLESLGVEPAEDMRSPGAERMLEEAGESFGAGELGALRLYAASGADAIVSDDRTFANFLAHRGILAFAAVDALVALVESGRLSTGEGVESLERLREHTRAPVFESALASIRAVSPGAGDEGRAGESDERVREADKGESGDDD